MVTMSNVMNIGQAAKQSTLSTKMIRYYEEIGLIEKVRRSDSGYRLYSEQDIKDLNFIRHARDLGFSTQQIKELIQLWQNTNRQSAEVKQMTLKHIETLNQKIEQLQNMVLLLQVSANQCAGDENTDCAILDQLEKGI